jgi:hypothetical protein
MDVESLPVVTIRCKDCQFYRDYENYQVCIFWSLDKDDEFIEAYTEPDGYCHNALPHKDSNR